MVPARRDLLRRLEFPGESSATHRRASRAPCSRSPARGRRTASGAPMTMSRKSIESSSSCSRSFSPGFKFVRSSSGATVWMMSTTAFGSLRGSCWWDRPGRREVVSRRAAHDERRVDAEHAEGQVQDRVDPGRAFGSFATRFRTSQAGSRSSTLIVGAPNRPRRTAGSRRARASRPPIAWPMKLFVLLRACGVAEDGAGLAPLLVAERRRGRVGHRRRPRRARGARSAPRMHSFWRSAAEHEVGRVELTHQPAISPWIRAPRATASSRRSRTHRHRLGDDDAVACLVERSRGLRRVLVKRAHPRP